MSLTGKSSTGTLRKKDFAESKSSSIGYKKLMFAHKATLGDTQISLSSLSLPSEMASLGFTNPTVGELTGAQLFAYKNNLTLTSSARGQLIQGLSYTVDSSTKITLQGFTALENEIFVGVIDGNVRSGLQVVDAAPLVATGTISVGVADFNVGQPFTVNQYPSAQVGAVTVFRNGVQQFRNSGNSSTVLDGNYYEVNAGSGLGVIIRFNNAPTINTDNILVVSTGLISVRPDGSMLATIENLQGQLDQVIPTVADLAGVPQTNFRAAPNNVDLKAFGDRVLAAETNIAALNANNVIGSYTPSGSFATGVPGASIKQVYPATYTKIGNTVHVTGTTYFRNDGSTVNFTWTLPVTNANTPINVSGSMIRTAASGETAGAVSRLIATANNSTTVTFSNTGITINGSDSFWTYDFIYTLV